MNLCPYRPAASQRPGLSPLVLKDTQDEDWDRKVPAVPLLPWFWPIPKSRRVFRKWHRHTLRPSISFSGSKTTEILSRPVFPHTPSFWHYRV